VAAPDQITEPPRRPDSAGMAVATVSRSRSPTTTPLTPRRLRGAQAVVKARKVELRRATAGRILQRQQLGRPLLHCGPVPTVAGSHEPSPRPLRYLYRCRPRAAPEIRGRRGAAIAARKRAFAEWDKANPGAVYDPELFRREILPRLAAVKFTEIAEAAGCSKAYASDIRRGKRTPHVSTWKALGKLVGVEVLESATS